MPLLFSGLAFAPALFLMSHQAFAAPVATATPATINSCRVLSIGGTKTIASDPGEAVFRKVLTTFEESFAGEDEFKFRSVLHPSLQLAPSKRHNLFVSTFSEFGLRRPELGRTQVYELNIENSKDPSAVCDGGLVRGVVGPKKQWVVFHTILDAHEQARFMSIFAPVPEAVENRRGSQFSVGLVMFHTQSWSHERKSPTKLLEEARKWSALGSPLAGWLFAESAVRLLDANPYFVPQELADAKSTAEEMRARGVNLEELRSKLSEGKSPWKLLDLSVVYQASGIEPGVRFLSSVVLEPVKLEENCRKNLKPLLKMLSQLRDRFHGVECIPYAAGEEQSKAPEAGTVFLNWEQLK